MHPLGWRCGGGTVPVYAFETISAAQALDFSDADTLTFATGASNQVTVLYGVDGNVTIAAGGRSVLFNIGIIGGSQAGRLVTSDGSRIFIGASGDDTASAPANSANDAVYGGAGNDSLDGGGGDDLLQGNAGHDYIVGGLGFDVIYGGQDDDYIISTIPLSGSLDFVFPADRGGFAQGNRGNDIIEGTLGNDTLLGGQGDDKIEGFTGQDFLNGNLGDDVISGEGLILGEDGNDRLIGKGLADTLLGGAGNDRIASRGGRVDGGEGADFIQAGQGAAGDNIASGGEGTDTITAELTSASVAHQFTFFGDDGDDSLVGSPFGDTLSGGDGNDTISGGPIGLSSTVDVFSGGAGQDLFIVRHRTPSPSTGELVGARITDWEASDKIAFLGREVGAGSAANYREIFAQTLEGAYRAAQDASAQGVKLLVAQVGGDVAIFGMAFQFEQQAIVLTGRTLADIGFENFV